MSDRFQSFREALAQTGVESSDFDLNPEVTLPEGRSLRPAGVLAPVADTGTRLELILTKRSSALKHHPGQIAFPGGKQDGGDADVIAGFSVTPVIGYVTRDFTVVPEPGEVEEVFRVPLDHVLNPSNYLVHSRRWRGQQRYYYAVPYGPYYIWGATARMLRAWAIRMNR